MTVPKHYILINFIKKGIKSYKNKITIINTKGVLTNLEMQSLFKTMDHIMILFLYLLNFIT